MVLAAAIAIVAAPGTPFAQQPASSLSGTQALGAARANNLPERRNPLERRVQLLTRELGLDARQQAQLRAILQSQRDAVSRIWADPDLLPQERGPATRAVEQQTADRIRAMLSDDQKKKYVPPPPDKPVTAGLSSGAGGPDVEKWLEAMRSQSAGGASP